MANTKVILFLLCLLPMSAIAQQLNHRLKSSVSLFPVIYNTQRDSLALPVKAFYNAGDSIWYYFLFIAGVCKGNYFAKRVSRVSSLPVQAQPVVSKEPAVLPAGLTLHGNMNYDFFYRSAADTPYLGTNIMQHSVRVNMYATLKKVLPVAVHIQMRYSNSPLFKNYTDATVAFNGEAFQSALKEKLKAKITERIGRNAPDRLLYDELQKKYALQQQLAQWLQHGRQVQQLADNRQAIAAITGNTDISEYNKAMLEEKINDYLQNTPVYKEEYAGNTQWMHKGAALAGKTKQIAAFKKLGISSVTRNVMSIRQQNAIDYVKAYIAKREQYKQVSEEVKQWEEKYSKAKALTRLAIDSARQLTDATNDPSVLQDQAKKYGLDSNKIYKRIKQLMAVKKFAVGRSSVDYTELTAKNISVTGINVEYSSRFYYAVAAGTVDYRYRDFIASRNGNIKQYLILIRTGIGKKEGNNLILSLYRGRKQGQGFTSTHQPLTNSILGFSVEGRYYFNKNSYVLAEIAKSSYPRYASLQNSRDGAASKISALSDRSNEAYAVQFFSGIPATGTRIYGQYKRTGINFQSFTVFNYNAQYAAWQVRADQFLFKRKLFVTAAIKNNAYNSPYSIYNYRSNTIFKSIQATFRLKKWPVITAGYMPSSQLNIVGNEIMETRFNMAMATINYAYRLKQHYLFTTVMYTRFFNHQEQQHFLYYNAGTWLLSHSVSGNGFVFNSSVAVSYSPGYHLTTTDEGLSYRLTKWLNMGGGLKWNRMNHSSNRLGYYGNAQVELAKLGEISIALERGFLPGQSQTLLPNDMGRVIYSKTF
ncbi:hypothetical protein [Agriterribacter sp.]|uniref:hypothetical protein n=1 Tax=Agriterribacter sp. TaxID=2821509 RepID=UPI002C3EC242|nr:hypothetical protein [Agriterribacter sp.]HRO46814.1 hypothetical protein [Agriterribacter sp.]HRQ15577.1 hypothetical protein [Agriterribacter sp.]